MSFVISKVRWSWFCCPWNLYPNIRLIHSLGKKMWFSFNLFLVAYESNRERQRRRMRRRQRTFENNSLRFQSLWLKAWNGWRIEYVRNLESNRTKKINDRKKRPTNTGKFKLDYLYVALSSFFFSYFYVLRCVVVSLLYVDSFQFCLAFFSPSNSYWSCEVGWARAWARVRSHWNSSVWK